MSLAEKIVGRMTSGAEVGRDELEIITYGLNSLLAKGVNFLLPLPIILFLGLGKEYLVLWIILSFLRPRAGGYHARTQLRCLIFSTVLLLASTAGVRVWEYGYRGGRKELLILILFMELAISLAAPVDTENKRLTKEEKGTQKKRVIGFLMVLNLFLAISYYWEFMMNFYVVIQVLLCQLILLAGGIVKNKGK